MGTFFLGILSYFYMYGSILNVEFRDHYPNHCAGPLYGRTSSHTTIGSLCPSLSTVLISMSQSVVAFDASQTGDQVFCDWYNKYQY